MSSQQQTRAEKRANKSIYNFAQFLRHSSTVEKDKRAKFKHQALPSHVWENPRTQVGHLTRYITS